MKKRKRLFAMILVMAIALTTVLSTVAAFASEVSTETGTDDYDDDDDDRYNDDDTDPDDTFDYSHLAPASGSVAIEAEKGIDGYTATGTMELTGMPAGGYIDDYDIDLSSSNNDITFSYPSITTDNDNKTYLTFTSTGLGTAVLTATTHDVTITFEVTITSKYDYSTIVPEKRSYTVYSESTYREITVPLTGIPEGADITYLDLSGVKSSNKKMSVYMYLSGNALSISVNGAGTTNVSFRLEGTKHTVRIKLVHVYIKENCYRIAKGKTVTVKVNGVNKGIKWKTLNKSIASVSSKGKVKGKKNGCAVISATVTCADKTKIVLGTAVNVTSAKKLKAFKWAHSYSSKSIYSQPKRMKKGYYDCSSLVWRAYRTTGYSMVQKGGWAPTAASIAQWLMKRHKGVGYATGSNYNKRKFQIGDLYFETGKSNGRYKGVYHVEMFGGYSFGGFDYKGKPYLITTYANRSDGYYGPDRSDFYCRP